VKLVYRTRNNNISLSLSLSLSLSIYSVHTVYIVGREIAKIYGHIRCKYTVLANPTGEQGEPWEWCPMSMQHADACRPISEINLVPAHTGF